ncbi:hypothetical protein K3495_g6401 [Podosphaera aphanis]|nr:hypothetical protein K3495_g6401 [Podosphaera aphanis]
METYRGYVRTPADAIKLFEACRLGVLPRVQRRLSEKERQSIKSGSVFVWDEREAGMRRWTDGKSWSASRVSGSFLTYREMEGKRGGQTLSPRPKPRQVAITVPEGCQVSDDEIDHEEPDGYRYKVNGLIKQSFSIKTLNGQHLHLISYYSRPAPSNTQELCQPTLDPQLRHIIPIKDMYPDASAYEGQTHEGQPFTIDRTLIQTRVHPQAYQVHFQRIGKPNVSQEFDDRPHKLSHSPEYKWPTSSVITSPIASGYSSAMYNNSSLPSPNHPCSPMSSFQSSPHQPDQPSLQPQIVGSFNRQVISPNTPLPPAPPIADQAQYKPLYPQENPCSVTTTERQIFSTNHILNSSTQYSSENVPAKSVQYSIQRSASTPPLPDLKTKPVSNYSRTTDFPLISVSKPLETSTNTRTHGGNIRDLAPIDYHGPLWNSDTSTASSIPSITSLVLGTESVLNNSNHKTFEEKTANLPNYWDRSDFPNRDARAEVLREQLDLMGEDQRAIRVLDRRFCV